jgi:hypothetical protein
LLQAVQRGCRDWHIPNSSQPFAMPPRVPALGLVNDIAVKRCCAFFASLLIHACDELLEPS